MIRKYLFIICLLSSLLVFCPFLRAQPAPVIRLLATRDPVSFRGLSIPSDSVVWASGSQGTVGRSLNGGRTWEWMQVPGHETRDFRDIEAFDAQTALIMAIAEPAHLLKTTDGGKSWKLVFADSTAGMFLDALHFRDPMNGIVAGDPVAGKFFMRRTRDGGETWQPVAEVPAAQSGEALFAASGTNIILKEKGEFVMVTGGKVSRLLRGKGNRVLPLVQGQESTGAFSLAAWAEKLVVVGGDFKNDQATAGNCLISTDSGETWQRPSRPPRGYRSCVAFRDARTLFACGTPGVDISADGGQNWRPLSTESYHVCVRSKTGRVVYFAGAGGKIAVLNF